MKLQITIPRRSLDNLRFLLHPSRAAALYLIFLFALLAFASSTRNPSSLIRGIGIVLFLTGLVTSWFSLIARRLAPPTGLLFYLALGWGLMILQRWWEIPYPTVPLLLFAGIVALSAASYGVSDALLILALMANLQLMLHLPVKGTKTGFEFELGLEVMLLAGLAILLGYLTSGQRRKILSLREEVMLAKGEAAAYLTNVEAKNFFPASHETGEGKADLESLESSIEAILHRIQEYFQAQSVLLYQPYGENSLKLRHAVSVTGSVHVGHVLDTQSTPLGAIYLRGITCNWNFDDPDSEIRSRHVTYYTDWQQVRNLAGCPLKMLGQAIGMLILDRNLERPFTGLEMKHLEIFAIQLAELIQMGKRYLEQLDRNMEYRIFYQAMSRLARSLATQEVLEALAGVCQEVAPSTHVLIALLDETRLSYELAYTHGIPSLQGCKVDSHGRTWLSWMLNSKSGPIMLRDIRSHVSTMPIASPKEGPLPVRSVLLIPLIAEGAQLGVVLLGTTKVDSYRHWHMRILASICSQASANIENSLLHRKVENEALSDGLTHLYNHRFFQERLQSECSRVKRGGGSLSLLMIDIDHFKKVNDTYGHRIGDMVLQQTAAILKGHLRSEDTIARYGGEEFVVILSGSGKKGALKMAERSRLAVTRAVLIAEEHRIGASVSIGTATFPEDASQPWELIERADRALYAAKEQGRNRVVQYHSLGQEGARMTGIR